MKNKLMILACLLSLSALNAAKNENDLVKSLNPTTGEWRTLTQKDLDMETLNSARQARAEGDYRNAGLTLYSLARNQNSPTAANAARRELQDMQAKGQWNNAMLARLNEQ